MKQRVLIHMPGALVEVMAEVQDGLALHSMSDDDDDPYVPWTITHHQSGLLLAWDYSYWRALDTMERFLASGINFQKSANAFTKADKKKLRELRD